MKIAKLSIQRPIAVTVLILALTLVGIYSFFSLEVNYLPEVTYPMIKIYVQWRGATPEDIDLNIADPIERVLSTVDNLDYISSSSIEGMYSIMVNFNHGVNVDAAYQDVIAAMGRVSNKLPKDIETPIIFKADPSQLPVIQAVISSEKRSLVELREWADKFLTDKITNVQGIAGVEIVGGLKREIRINVLPEKLTAYNLSIDQISKAISQSNNEMFAGRVTIENREIIARTMGEFESLDELRNVEVFRTNAGQVVYLKDVARVEDSNEEMRVNTRFNGKPCVQLSILKQAAANTVKVAEELTAYLEKIKNTFPADIKIGYVENQAVYVSGAISSVRDSAILSAILVILVVYIFLGNWRMVLIMIIALPFTLIVNVFIMQKAGFSLNIFSLGGLVISLGIILDNSIVVLENIVRHKSEKSDDFVFKGVSEVTTAITAATLTFIVLLVPFLLVKGLVALLFKELVMVIGSIVLISYLVAFTVTPMLSHKFLSGVDTIKLTGLGLIFDKIVSAIMRIYKILLNKAMKFKIAVIVIFIILFVMSLFAAKKIGGEFIPSVDDGRIMIKLKMPVGASVEKTGSVLKQLEEKIKDMPEIQSYFTLVGGKVWGLQTYEIANEGEIDVQLVPKSKRKISTLEEIAKIKERIKKVVVPGAKIPVMQMKVKGIPQAGNQDVEIKLYGSDIAEIYEAAQKTAKELQEVKGLTNVNISMNIKKPEYRISIDRARASAVNVSVEKIAKIVKSYISGVVTSQYRDGSYYYNIRIITPEKNFTAKEDLENLIIDNGIYLKDVAKIEPAFGPVEIIRENQIKQIIVGSDPEGISLGEAAELAKKTVSKIKLPSSITFDIGGKAQLMNENQKVMMFIISFAVIFAFVILAIQFESYILPFLIITVIPLSLTGVFSALGIFGIPIGVTVLIGLIVMMGGITSQGVTLITLAEEYMKQGLTPLDAVLKAAPLRLKAILMTQLTTILGLFPLALNIGEGGDMLKPMAVAVIGGLIFSLFLTLFFLPAAYTLVKRVKS